MSYNVINLMDVCRHGTTALGPGLRYVIWTQGCPFDCPGCISPESHDVNAGKLVDIDALVGDIIAQKHITGLTISGGEPFLQADAVLKVLKQLKVERPEIDVIIYTGFKLEDLLSAIAQEVLSYADVLIDGRYDHKRNDGYGLRGSSNQRIHFLSGRLIEYKEELENGKRKIEIDVDGHYMRTIGIPLVINNK